MNSLRAIFGLGNPGPQYQDTRHNCGFKFIDALAAAHQAPLQLIPKLQAQVSRTTISNQRVLLVKPLTFMNLSGTAYRLVTQYFDIEAENTIVAYDELDLPVGVVRLKSKGGHGGHNGIEDIIAKSKSKNFLRVRVGIGRPRSKTQTVSYVLGKAPLAQQALIDEAISCAADWVPEMIAGELERAMHFLHSRENAPQKKSAAAGNS